MEESILTELGIPYRVVAIAVGDLGASAAMKWDCEAWLPGQQRYRELTSCSNTTDYQARRLDIRFRGADGKLAHVHTLNGTAVAVGRTIIALLENGQRDDGSVALPGGTRASRCPGRASGRRLRRSVSALRGTLAALAATVTALGTVVAVRAGGGANNDQVRYTARRRRPSPGAASSPSPSRDGPPGGRLDASDNGR